MEAHIDDVCLGTNTQEDNLILLGEFFAVCQENHTRLKLEKCELMQETLQYLGLDVGYGWWTPAASKAKPLMDAKVRHEDPKKRLHDVRSFWGMQLLWPPYPKLHLHQRHPLGPDHEHLGFNGVQKSQNQLQSEILLFLSNYTIKSIFFRVSPRPALQIGNFPAPRSTMQA